MTKYFSLLLIIIANALNAEAQGYFLKTYDFGTVENSYQILSYNGRFYINTATYCGTECSFLTEIDSTGSIIWRTEIPDIDIASGTMVIANDTITITGNNDPFNTAFRMAHFTLDGVKLGNTLEIEHPTRKFTSMFQLTTQYFNGKYVICGPGEQGDTNWSLIYVVSPGGELDTLITLEPTNHESDLWDSYIDREGRLTTIHQVEFAHSPVNYRKIFKFNENFDTVWTYTSEFNDDNNVIPYGCELHDGRTIISFVNPQGSLVIHSVRAINLDGTLDWQHNYVTTGSRTRYILRLKTLSNGDIMGCGQYGELTHIPKVSGAPWLFRMSPDGDLLWERTYVDIDTSTMKARFGTLFDFIETEKGDILAVGYFQFADDDMLILRVDSSGCFSTGTCPEVNILTEDEDLNFAPNDFVLYPNPMDKTFFIRNLAKNTKLDYEFFDGNGKREMRGTITPGLCEIKIDNFSSGIYFILLYEEGRLVATKRFVKISSN